VTTVELNAAVRIAMERRWQAAMDLVRAQDMMSLLGKVSRAGGTVGITPADTDRLRHAQHNWKAWQ
jgi:hypothetical protein